MSFHYCHEEPVKFIGIPVDTDDEYTHALLCDILDGEYDDLIESHGNYALSTLFANAKNTIVVMSIQCKLLKKILEINSIMFTQYYDAVPDYARKGYREISLQDFHEKFTSGGTNPLIADILSTATR